MVRIKALAGISILSSSESSPRRALYDGRPTPRRRLVAVVSGGATTGGGSTKIRADPPSLYDGKSGNLPAQPMHHNSNEG